MNTLHAGNPQSSGNTDHAGMVQQTSFSLLANPKAWLPKFVLPQFRGVITQWQTFSLNDCLQTGPNYTPN